jgi:hypothetical protein
MMATAHSEAAVVAIDLTNVGGNNITGVNGGVANGSTLTISNWLGAGTGTLDIYNNANGDGGNYLFGFDGDYDLQFAGITGAYGTYPRPRNFSSGAAIDSSASWQGGASISVFSRSGTDAPDFGAGSFMGFRFSGDGGTNWNYGYFEVTWNSTTNVFQILSGAYESTANTAITTPAAVPGAGLSAMALMALGGGSFRRRSRDRVA